MNNIPTYKAFDYNHVPNHMNGMYDYGKLKSPNIMTQANQRPHTSVMLSCKPPPKSGVVGRRPPMVDASCSVQFGYARTHPKGLFYEKEKPLDIPLMRPVNSFETQA